MKLLVLCIGNRDGGDDSIGPYIADYLQKNGFENVIDAGIIPENFTGVVKEKKPDELLIIDAIDMDLDPGEIRFVSKEKIGEMTISTHGIPLSVLIKYLEISIEKIFLIGIQPKEMSGKITPYVKKSGEKLAKLIIENKFNQLKNL